MLSVRLACALSWHPDLFVAGWRQYNRLQRGAVGLGEWGHALSLAWLVGVAVVVELCVSVHGSHEHECALWWHLDLL